MYLLTPVIEGLRDAVYALVGQGQLVPPDADADTSFHSDEQPDTVEHEQLSNEARELLLEAVKDPSGTLFKVNDSSGLTVQANKKNMLTAPKDGRCQALWEAAVEELVDNVLIADVGHKGQVFRVTRSGYELADLLS